MIRSERQGHLEELNEKSLKEVTVPSVQIILIRSGKNGPEVALGHRISGGFLNQWTFPGGRIDEGENDKEAAIREASEEVGVLISGQNLFFFRSTKSSTKRKEYNAIYNYEIKAYVASGEGLSIRNASPAEFDEVKWMSIKNALTMHEQAVSKAKESGNNIEPDQIADALAPKTFKILQLLSNCPFVI